jgi:hypothetical protein
MPRIDPPHVELEAYGGRCSKLRRFFRSHDRTCPHEAAWVFFALLLG